MSTPQHYELYRSFLEFVGRDLRVERSSVNRRMLSVFFWCFLLPAGVSITLLLLVKGGVLRPSARSYLDWVVLVFPVLYSLYFLSSQVLANVPRAFRQGGVALSLGQAAKDGEWRERVLRDLGRDVKTDAAGWRWLVANFRMDLENMQNRARYLTALAGAVFFLLMQGIDSIGTNGGAPDPRAAMSGVSFMNWIENGTSDLSQFVGLALFLLLLYLSSSQNYYALVRYLNCAELLAAEK